MRIVWKTRFFVVVEIRHVLHLCIVNWK